MGKSNDGAAFVGTLCGATAEVGSRGFTTLCDPLTYFIETLTLRSWCFEILPRLLWRRVRVRHRRDRRCYVIDGGRCALAVARAWTWATGVVVGRLPFRMLDIVDDEGFSLRLRIAYKDLAEAQADALRDPAFRTVIEEYHAGERMSAFLAKVISSVSLFQRETLWRALLTIQVCRWTVRREPEPGAVAVFFLQRRPWMRAIASYAARHGVLTVPVSPAFQVKTWLRGFVPPEVKVAVRWLRSLWYERVGLRHAPIVASRPRGPLGPGERPRLAVEYYGHLNLAHPERHSDLFFWQQSALAAEDVLVTFSLPRDPLDEQKWVELNEHGFSAVALEAAAATVRGVPIFIPRPRVRREYTPAPQPGLAAQGQDAKWLRRYARYYVVLRDTWEAFFSATGVKVYVSWFKYDGSHCVIADALQRVGGVMAIYQRAYEYHPSVETTITADVVFGFSQLGAELERRSNSVIPYHVTTGYLGDHRFPLLREKAGEVRQRLQGRGVERIVAFFDENSGEDPRWHTGHGLQREHYAFLLEKVLAHPWLALVVKPKVPSTLRRRLGPVAEVLQRAEATGRCLVYEGGALHSSHTPVEAALAADLAIHGHLCAATAGLEAALAGVPTLLLDREGWPSSPLYQLGVGRVVFPTWQALWDACVEHWNRPEGIPGFGDWSPLFDELDPFRDGRAAERMGTYLMWLLEGFQAGWDRETVLAAAAERYTSRWGKDKVSRVGLESPCALAAADSLELLEQVAR